MGHATISTSPRASLVAAIAALGSLLSACGASSAPPTTVIHLTSPPPAPSAPATEDPEDEPAPTPRSTSPIPRDLPDAAPDDDRDRARTLFLEGAAAYDQGDYLRAREKFQAAYDLVQLLPLLFNIASAEMRLGNVTAACTLFRQYVTQGDPADPRIQEVQKQITQRCRTP